MSAMNQPPADDGLRKSYGSQDMAPIAGSVTVLRPVLRHDRDALAEIWSRLGGIMPPADAVIWLISPHPALSNKHPIWCQADELRALLDGATHDELLAQ